jgi:hypothetical protein
MLIYANFLVQKSGKRDKKKPVAIFVVACTNMRTSVIGSQLFTSKERNMKSHLFHPSSVEGTNPYQLPNSVRKANDTQ